MQLTVPQILMLNHAAWVQNERMKERSNVKVDVVSEQEPNVFNGKPVSELSSDEMAFYLGSFGREDF
jgi:hypothetical protein